MVKMASVKFLISIYLSVKYFGLFLHVAGSEPRTTGPCSPSTRLALMSASAVTSSCTYMAHERLSYAFSVWRMEGDWSGGGHV